MGHTGCCCSAAAAPLGPEDWEQIAGRHAETVSRGTWPHVGYRDSVAQMRPSVIAIQNSAESVHCSRGW